MLSKVQRKSHLFFLLKSAHAFAILDPINWSYHFAVAGGKLVIRSKLIVLLSEKLLFIHQNEYEEVCREDRCDIRTTYKSRRLIFSFPYITHNFIACVQYAYLCSLYLWH